MGKEICRDCRLGPCKGSQKKCDGLEEDLMALDGRYYTEDVYGPGEEVSLEGERGRQLRLQEELDNQVLLENLYDDPDAIRRKGLPPCLRIRKSF